MASRARQEPKKEVPAGEQSVIFVEEMEGTSIGTLEAPEELSALMERLNPNGQREKILLDNLTKRNDQILQSLGYHPVNLDVEHTPRYSCSTLSSLPTVRPNYSFAKCTNIMHPDPSLYLTLSVYCFSLSGSLLLV